ncbi:hypothetical protein ACFLQU_01940 [Verrucomicrobiota bacterium]
MRYARKTIPALVLLLAAAGIAAAAVGPYDQQEFSFPTWQNTSVSGNVTRDNWQLVNGYVNMNALFNNPFPLPKSPHSGDNFDCAVWLTTVSSAFITPEMPDGVNVLSFYVNIAVAGSSDFAIQSSPNGVDSWTTLTNMQVAVQGWQQINYTNIDYNSVYLRIISTGESPANQYLGLDDILVTRPPAFVAITDVTVDPDSPIIGSLIDIKCHIDEFSDVSSLVVTSYWQVGTTGAWTAVPMQIDGNPASNNFVTISQIPGQAPQDTLLRYYIVATYEGTDNFSPTLYPAGGVSNPVPLIYRQPIFFSNYTNVYLTGAVSTNMDKAGDYLWQKVVTVATNLVDAGFRFDGTNAGGITTWGEDAQPFTDMPVFDSVETNGGYITMGGTNTGHLLFSLSESIGDYSAQLCEFVDFDGWAGAGTFGTYTNGEGWVISDSRITTGAAQDQSRVFRGTGESCIMDEDAGPQYIRSPYLPDGVGEIGFWYRNWETNGAAPTEFYVQVAANVGGPWTTVGYVGNMRALDYLRFSHVRSDRDNHYVRILRGTNENAKLCIDGLVVARPGPGVTFAAPTTAPPAPTVVDTVDITATATLWANASNPQCTLWYRYNTNTAFKSIAMTPAALTFTTDTPIPNMPLGAVQYYIECVFDGMSSTEKVTTYHPVPGADSPLTYNVVDWSIGQNFHFPPWNNEVTSKNVLKDGWHLIDGYVSMNALFNNPFVLPKSTVPGDNLDSAVWLTNTNSALMTATALTYGAGRLTFWANNAGAGANYFSIQHATNVLGPWTTVTSSVQTVEGWTEHSFEINEPGQVYVRVLKTAQTGGGANGQLMGIDDVTLTLPPAMVRISNPMIHPGYPASNEAVTVSCSIESINPAFRAFNVWGRVWYRTGESGPFTNYVTLAEVSSNYFESTTTIPALPTDTKVEYYYESIFNGYAHTADDNHSPTFLPAGIRYATNTQYFIPPQAGFFGYAVRRYMSDYDVLQLSGTQSINLEQQDDFVWQGIIDFGSGGATNPVLYLAGLLHYTGSNYWPVADTWADLYQTRTTVPMYSVMYPAETNGLTMGGKQTRKFVFRFDEKNMTYILHRCAFQDFDDWYASAEFFDESYSTEENIIVTTNDFDDWLLSKTVESPMETFQSWSITAGYTNGTLDGANGWTIQDCAIIGQLDNDKACEMIPLANFGFIRTVDSSFLDGISHIEFDYRCVDTNHYPALYWGATNWANSTVSATLKGTALPVDDTGDSFGNCWLSLYARYNNPNYYYELRLQQTGRTQYQLRLYRKNGPTATYLATVRTYNGDIGVANDITMNVSDAAAGGYVTIEIWGPEFGLWHYYDAAGLTSPGAIGVDTHDADIQVDNVDAGWVQLQWFDNWSDGTWNETTTNLQWVLKNGITADSPNDGYVRLARPADYSGAYIRSPLLPHGVRRIRVEQRSTADWRPYKYIVQWSATGGSGDGEWVDIKTENQPSSSINGDWRGIDTWTNLAINNIYIRFRVANDSANEAWLRRISIWPASGLDYSENFNDGAAQDWTDTGAGWSGRTGTPWNVYVDAATNGVYTRPGYTGQALDFDVQTAIKNSNLLLNQSWTTRAAYTNTANSDYIRVSVPVEQSGTNNNYLLGYVRIKHRSGEGSLILDNLQYFSWHGGTTNTNGWVARECWVTTDGALSGKCMEFSASRAYEEELNDGNQCLRTGKFTNGLGYVSLRHTSLNGSPVSFEVQWVDDTNSSSWASLGIITNDQQTWQYFSRSVNSDLPELYVRIIHRSTNNPNARLLLDGLEITSYISRDENNWVGYNILVTPIQTNRLWLTGRHPLEKTAYLNFGPGIYDPDTPNELTNFTPHIQSPYLADGIGEISFWYRNWTEPPAPTATLRIHVAPDYTLPESNWTEIAVMTNFTEELFHYFQLRNYDITNHYVRFYADGLPLDRICFDDVLIMAPLGADLVITNLVTVPEIPLTDDEVHVRVNLAQFLLDVNVTNLELHYTVGTNDWGRWSPGNVINMSQVTNDPAAGSYIWQTDTPIPGYGADTTIQYHVFCQFDGEFANKGGSPKDYRAFVNPAHYSPRDLNTESGLGGGTNTIPYYIVFSCLPGTVWFNEVNVADAYEPFNPLYTNEYVELAGPSLTDIGGWMIDILDENASVKATYTLTQGEQVNDSGSGNMGFWVLGDATVPNVDMAFTHEIQTGRSMPEPVGALRLRRSMGAIEYRICYGASNRPNLSAYEYIGNDDWVPEGEFFGFLAGSLQLSGTGSNYADFSWGFATNVHTQGDWNDGQFPPPPPPSTNGWIMITDFRMSAASISIDYVQSNLLSAPAPWFSTNIMDTSSWTKVSTYSGPVETSGTYTVTFDVPTNYPVYFYRIRIAQ